MPDWLTIPWIVVHSWVSSDCVCKSIHTVTHEQCKTCQVLRRLRILHKDSKEIPYATSHISFEEDYAFHDPQQELWGACALPWTPSFTVPKRFLIFTEKDLATCAFGRNVGAKLLNLVYNYDNGPGGPAGETAILGFSILDPLGDNILADIADNDDAFPMNEVELALQRKPCSMTKNGKSVMQSYALHTCDACQTIDFVRRLWKQGKLLVTLCWKCSRFYPTE